MVTESQCLTVRSGDAEELGVGPVLKGGTGKMSHGYPNGHNVTGAGLLGAPNGQGKGWIV